MERNLQRFSPRRVLVPLCPNALPTTVARRCLLSIVLSSACSDATTSVPDDTTGDSSETTSMVDTTTTSNDTGSSANSSTNTTADESSSTGGRVGDASTGTTNSSPDCGDGVVDVDEECDDGEATSRCDADCTLAECGDGTLNVLAGEDCDSGSFGEKTCADLGFLGGQLSCDQACAVDATQCGEFSVALSQTRRLDFFWPPVVNADYYEIHEEATPGGPPQQLGAKIFGETAAFEVPLHLRHNATYWLSACTEGKCSPVASLDLTGSLVDGIGVLQTDAPLASGIGATVSMSADGQTLATGNDFQRTYIFVRTGLGTWEFQTELTPSNLTFGDNFGASVSLSADGNVLAVGSPGEDSAASGINGDGDDNSLSSSGAAYVYTRDAAGVWTEQAYVKASNPGAGDIFGTAVVLNAAGDTLVVGARGEDSGATGIGGDQSDDSAPGVGAAYIFFEQRRELVSRRIRQAPRRSRRSGRLRFGSFLGRLRRCSRRHGRNGSTVRRRFSARVSEERGRHVVHMGHRR